MPGINGAERIVSGRSVQRSGAVQEHLLDQMLATAKEKVRYRLMSLDNATQLSFDLIALILENALDLVENDDHFLFAASRNLGWRSKHLLKFRACGARTTHPKRDFRLTFFIERHGGCKLPKEFFGRFQDLLCRATHGFRDGLRRHGNEGEGAIAWP